MNEINFLADEIHQPLTKLMIIIKMFTESYLIDPINEIPQTDESITMLNFINLI